MFCFGLKICQRLKHAVEGVGVVGSRGGGGGAEAMAQQQQQHFNNAYARSRKKEKKKKETDDIDNSNSNSNADVDCDCDCDCGAPLRGFVYGLPSAEVLLLLLLLERWKKGGWGDWGVGASGSVEKPRLGLGGLLCNEAKRLTLFVRFFARCFVCFFFETGIPCEYGNPSSPLPSSASLHLCQLLAWAQPLHPYSA